MPEPVNRIRRSQLSTPATSDKMVAKAATSDADVVFLDLEDAVAPALKADARRKVVAALVGLDFGRSRRACRINGVATPWCHDDLIEVVTGAGAELELVIVPKITGPRDVWFVDDLLTQLELKLGLEPGRIAIEVLIEEVAALARVDEIAHCSPRLEAMTLGMGDLAASQGMRLGHVGVSDGGGGPEYPGDIWHYARSRLIVAARTAGIDALDGPYANFADPDGFLRSASTFSMLGGAGKWCIHPSQIEPANRVFAPTAAEIDEARAVVGAMDAAEAAGEGAANLDGVMIDAASARSFRATLDRARQCGLID